MFANPGNLALLGELHGHTDYGEQSRRLEFLLHPVPQQKLSPALSVASDELQRL
jgi:hypothetical protein